MAATGGAACWFAGPGYLVAVGYMDPGNWATDVAGGAQLGYLLLSVILLSSLMAMLLQALSARLGIASGLDLAACRERYSPSTCRLLWLACETAIIACDLAEVIGTAIALKLLFGLPLAWGALLCVGDALLVLVLIGRGQRPLEAFVVALLTLIFACFAVQLLLSRPELGEVLQDSCRARECSATRLPCTWRSASSARPSCRTTSTCIPRWCRAAPTRAASPASARHCAGRWPTAAWR